MKKLYFSFALLLLVSIGFAQTTITNSGQTFTPDSVHVNYGETVIFNIGGTHDAKQIEEDHFRASGSFSTSEITQNGFSVGLGGGTPAGYWFSVPGKYYYTCEPHYAAGMRGIIVVDHATTPIADCSDLFFSQYMEGSGSNKVVEIFNPTSGAIDLSNYTLVMYNNGGNAWYDVALSGSLAGGATFVVANSNSDVAMAGNADLTSNQVMNHNGDDAIILLKNNVGAIDIIGYLDEDPGSSFNFTGGGTQNATLTRMPSVKAGETNWATSQNQWIVTASNDTVGFGSHTINSCGPAISIQTPSFTMNEGDPTTTVTNLIMSPTNPVAGTVEIHLVGGTGSAADLDLSGFGGSLPYTVPVAANSTSLFVPITPNDDAIYEGTETFNFVLRNSTNFDIGADSTFVLTMTDNETPPDTTVAFNPISITANEGDGTVDLTLEIGQLSAGSTTFSVDVQLISGTAADLGNYTTQTVSFPSTGTTTETVTLTLTDDATVEGTETFVFQLVNPSAGLTIGTNAYDTLTLTDNDIATSTMGSVTGVNASGVPTEMGNSFVLYGVVNSPDRGFNGTEFSFFDATGAITAFQEPALTYEASVGDSVEVTGTIGQRFGVTVITNLTSINLLSTGSSVSAAVATMPMESNESSLIRINGVQLVDVADWNAVGGAGFDVPAFTASNDTFVLRVDRDYVDVYNRPDAPCGVFDVMGVVGQYDLDTPYLSSYQIIPRFLSDIMDTCSSSPGSGTIADATEVDAQGEPVMFGVDMALKGIITSPDFRENQSSGTEFTFADGTGGIWAYSTDSTVSFNPVVGDSVIVYGNIGASSGVTRLYIDSVFSLGAATPFTPTVVSSALTEAHEAELITIENLTLSGTWNTSGGSYNVSASNGSLTFDIRVDADRAELFVPILTGSETFHLTGVGSQFDPSAPRTEGYQILPRFLSDIDVQTSIKEISLNNFTVYPIPANDVLNFSFDFDSNEAATVSLFDVVGRTSVSESITLVNGTNVNSISVAGLSAGFYILQIETSKGVSNTNVLIK